jgi:DNA-binding MurR/RpiR family transcriptional regulator
LSLGVPGHAISGELAGPAVKKSAIRPDDVFLGLGLTAMTPGASAMLKIARAAKATTVGIVGSLAHPLAAVAEYILVAPVQTTENMPSWTALSSMLNGIAQVIAVGRDESVADAALDSDQYLNAYAEILRQQVASRRGIALR